MKPFIKVCQITNRVFVFIQERSFQANEAFQEARNLTGGAGIHISLHTEMCQSGIHLKSIVQAGHFRWSHLIAPGLGLESLQEETSLVGTGRVFSYRVNANINQEISAIWKQRRIRYKCFINWQEVRTRGQSFVFFLEAADLTFQLLTGRSKCV